MTQQQAKATQDADGQWIVLARDGETVIAFYPERVYLDQARHYAEREAQRVNRAYAIDAEYVHYEPEPERPAARCGSTEPHGAHTGWTFRPGSRETFCAGNIGIVVEQR